MYTITAQPHTTFKELQKLYPHITEMEHIKAGTYDHDKLTECPTCKTQRGVTGYNSMLVYKDCVAGGWVHICHSCATMWHYIKGRACILSE